MDHQKPLIEINNLSVEYWQQGRWVQVIEGLSLQVHPAETFGLVGESGCGKSTTANVLLGFAPRGARYSSGEVWFEGQDLLKLKPSALQKVRGRKISLVPQNPTTALSPGMKVGNQVVEVLINHAFSRSTEEARQRTIELFRRVSLKSPEAVFNKYPHQLSGGQQQRVVIAMALACGPELIVLDEPTTGLDVTTQAQILDLLIDLRSQYGMAMFYITHNLGVVAQICTRIGVMYAGRLVEVAPTRTLFARPTHPYTQGLIASVPRISAPSRRQSLLLKGILRRSDLPPSCQFAPRCDFAEEQCFSQPQQLVEVNPGHMAACWRWAEIPELRDRLALSPLAIESSPSDLKPNDQPIVEVKNLQIGYGASGRERFLKRKPTIIVDDISFEVFPGETLALVGESGSGKTTIARALNGLAPYVRGEAKFARQHDLTLAVDQRSEEILRSIQLVFQNPDASLNPRQRVSKIIGRPLVKFFKVSSDEARERVERLLQDVRLDQSYYNRYPDELSGGERQRIAIARALAAEPDLLLCDEVLSALDVSVQANVLELLVELQSKRDITYLFISHDLAVVRSIAHHVGVLYAGTLSEFGEVEEVFNPPYHPYTDMLLKAAPEPDPDHIMPHTRADIGLLDQSPTTACPFAPRCPMKVGEICEQITPPWQIISHTHRIRCHLSLNELLSKQSKEIQMKKESVE
jgi:peptide/nickel transport system ATP-binding protein